MGHITEIVITEVIEDMAIGFPDKTGCLQQHHVKGSLTTGDSLVISILATLISEMDFPESEKRIGD